MSQIDSITKNSFISQEFWENNWKNAAGVALTTLVLALAVKHLTKSPPFSKFSPYLHHYVRNGYFAHGRFHVVLPKGEIPSLQQGIEFAQLLERSSQRMRLPEDEIIEIGQAINSPFTQAVVASPKVAEGYQNALRFIEANILKNPLRFFSQSSDEITRAIQNIHGLMEGGPDPCL